MVGVALRGLRGSGRGSSSRCGSGRSRSSLWSTTSLVVSKSGNIGLFFYHNGDDFTERYIFGVPRVEERSNVTFFLHFVINGGLVSLNADNHISRVNSVANFHVPSFKIALCKRKKRLNSVSDDRDVMSFLMQTLIFLL